MAIVKLKDYRDQKVSELLNIFKLPYVVYPRGYQVKLGPESVAVRPLTTLKQQDFTQ